MGHRQSGYQSARTQDSFVAILYGTAVVECWGAFVRFKTGGWHTRATCKAINGGLAEAGLTGYHARLLQGQVVVDCRGHVRAVGVELTLKLDPTAPGPSVFNTP